MPEDFTPDDRRMPATVWVDVEDLFDYARAHPRPSGIQRLALEAYAALHAHDRGAGRIRFVRHSVAGNGFRVVPWADIAALFADLTRGALPAQPKRRAAHEVAPRREFIRRAMHRLPAGVRPFASDALLSTILAARAWGGLCAALAREAVQAIRGRGRKAADGFDAAATGGAAASGMAADFDDAAQAGDVILVLGSPWSFPGYAAQIGQIRQQRGLRFAMLVYDIIPVRRPEWCDHGLVVQFRHWFGAMLPLCDHLFAISQFTAADLTAYMRELGITGAPPVVAVPIGSGVTAAADRQEAGQERSVQELAVRELAVQELPMRSDGISLPEAGSYVLFVSTIEIRKNHLLLFRIWRRLLEELPAGRVPSLVFAGRIGWLVADLIAQIDNTDHLNGKLVIIENLDDDDLTALYRGSLFTVFPSFYEGWGLPVTESLALGKPCLISNQSSLPEAGGTLARSFDPNNLDEAYEAVRGLIEDRDALARWEAEVKRGFMPVPWSATAGALLAGLSDGPFGVEQAGRMDAEASLP